MTARLNPGELEIELFCRGLRLDPSCSLDEDGRPIARTRAGLGSGLELVIPGPLKDLWLNAPVAEKFAQASPYVLRRAAAGPALSRSRPGAGGPGNSESNGYEVVHEHEGRAYPVRLPPEPAWYRRKTSSGVEMMRVGVLQGTYLGIYIGPPCTYWRGREPENCKFCTTGRNVGVNEALKKSVEDVVETALAAKGESGVTFVHLNSGYMEPDGGLDIAAPYVKALKERVGCLVGVQMIPTRQLWKYDWFRDLGADHFSFCYEFHNPEFFAQLLPGKERTLGRDTYFDALEYAAALLGKGACSGEIIAGVEPLPDTLRAIDYITSVGAFPTVCIFRPVIDADMEEHPSPGPSEMRVVMKHMWDACRRNGIPIGAAPNIEVSLIVNPTDAVYLAGGGLSDWWYRAKLRAVAWLARGHFRRMRAPRPVAESAETPATPRPHWGQARFSPSPLRAAVSPPGAFERSPAARFGARAASATR
ncbi:MAG: hypothetical protein L0216_17630 [Planctomycetales bacterium]|nr:hypothetical protein [Planctomycetales bacterium]